MRLESRWSSWRLVWCLAIILLLPFVTFGQDEDDDFIDPTRPSVSESATVQRAGVLQLEYGGDFDFRSPEFRSQQSGPLGLQFAVSDRVRLDLDVDTVVSQKDRMGDRATGVGDVSLGFKAIARDEPKERLAVAFAYSIKLPAASDEKELGSGRVDHNVRLIFNRTLGKTDVVMNFSYLNVGRDDSDRRASGAQAIFAIDYELPKNFGIITEFYGQSVDDEQPRGLYVLGALTYKVNRRLRLDVGARPGFGRDAPRVGLFAGLTIGVADFYRKRR
ncbi:MAG: transporter [Pyrinomonadaceae bacterium]|nr:transporter [Pyrinomonadaceae bacterium]